MTSPRTLIIHAGGGKAGSSAIQSALGRSVQSLAEVGIAYAHAPPAPSPYSITSGNGFLLYQKAANPDWTSRGKALIESYLAEEQVGICSSEFLGSMAESCWRRVLETAADASIEVKVVYFVRPAVEYVIASYNQDVKRGGEHRSFEEAARDATWQHLLDLQKLDSLFDSDHLQVINYDIARRDIVTALTSAYPELLPGRECLHSVGNVTVNRSLSSHELELMRHINARFGAAFGEQISNLLIEDEPEMRPALEISKEVMETLVGKFEDATSWVNSRFFSEPGMALEFRPSYTVAQSTSEGSDRALKIVLEWALDRIANGSDDPISVVREALLGIDWHNSNHPLIPRDFDPIAYLLINSDVLRTKNPPYYHYIESGHTEEREYRWPLQLDGSNETISQTIARLRLEDSEESEKAALWPRLRQALQLEALLNGFANREREYLDEIRRLHEEHGFDNERLRQRLSDTVRPIGDAIEATQSETVQLISGISKALETTRSESARVVSELGMALLPIQNELDSAREEQARTSSRQAAEIQESIAKLKADWASDMSALREEQSKLNAALRQKDAELAEQAESLRQYRQYGLLKYLKWALWRTTRP